MPDPVHTGVPMHETTVSRVTVPDDGISDTRGKTALESRLRTAIDRRRATGLFRKPRARLEGAVDFSSNDYLGVVRNRLAVIREEQLSGSTGSRLLTGHSSLTTRVEQVVCSYHDSPEALIFSSGYAANSALFSCLPGPRDAVVYDAAVHASVHDGIRASRAAVRIPFAHNVLDALRNALHSARKLVPADAAIIVAVESMYSMDGTRPPLDRLLAVAHDVRAHVIVDEAHAVGVYGSGDAAKYAKHPALFARLVAYGKAFGAFGAAVLCDSVTKDYLLNYARPLIYSTALPPHALATLLAAYQFMSSAVADEARVQVAKVMVEFRKCVAEQLPKGVLIDSDTPIQGVLVPGNQRVSNVARLVCEDGFDVYPIRAPTVEAGSERIRVVLHAHNTLEEVRGLVHALKGALQSPDNELKTQNSTKSNPITIMARL